jgi:pre-mRNA-processing factor 39
LLENHYLPSCPRLFERGAAAVGLDFHSHPFWDKYIEFEDRVESYANTFAILQRVVQIPMQKHREYFEKFRHASQYRPVSELADAEAIRQWHSDLAAPDPTTGLSRSEAEIERAIRDGPLNSRDLAIWNLTEAETRKRIEFENGIKRPYFHTTNLEDDDLENWRRYLDFEESEGNYERIVFLYERAVVICALHEEFWFRYARWMQAQPDKTQEVRIIFQRACTVWVPVAKPNIRRHYAIFEESQGNIAVAHDMYRAILYQLPNDVETIVSLANLERRHGGIDAAIAIYNEFLKSTQCDLFDKATITTEWATLLWKIKGSVDEAREVYQKNSRWYTQARPFWVAYFYFELNQPTSAEKEEHQYKLIKDLVDLIIYKSQIHPSAKKDIARVYMEYLLQRGTSTATKEWLRIDREVNGYASRVFFLQIDC